MDEIACQTISRGVRLRTARGFLCSLTILLLGLVVAAPSTRADDEYPRYNPVDLGADDEVRGEPPSPKEIEAAFNECLRLIDEEVKEMGPTSAHRHSHREAQTAMCRQNKNSCIMKPRGTECRAFIEDYAVEAVM